MLFLERSGYTEETYHTFSYSPIFDDDGAIAGHAVRGHRGHRGGHRAPADADPARPRRPAQPRTSRSAETVATACRELADSAGRPAVHAGLPVRRGRRHGPAGRVSTGFTGRATRPPRGDRRWPTATRLAGRPRRWPARPCWSTTSRAGSPTCPPARGTEPPAAALVVPLRAEHARPARTASWSFGLNRYRPLDDGYRDFCDLVAGQLAASITDARAYEFERGPGRDAGRARPGQDRLLHQRQPRVPHPADAAARARPRTRSPTTRDPLAGRQREPGRGDPAQRPAAAQAGQHAAGLLPARVRPGRGPLRAGRPRAVHPRAGQHVRDRRRAARPDADRRLRRRCPSRCTSTATCGPRSCSTCCPTP